MWVLWHQGHFRIICILRCYDKFQCFKHVIEIAKWVSPEILSHIGITYLQWRFNRTTDEIKIWMSIISIKKERIYSFMSWAGSMSVSQNDYLRESKGPLFLGKLIWLTDILPNLHSSLIFSRGSSTAIITHRVCTLKSNYRKCHTSMEEWIGYGGLPFMHAGCPIPDGDRNYWEWNDSYIIDILYQLACIYTAFKNVSALGPSLRIPYGTRCYRCTFYRIYTHN